MFIKIQENIRFMFIRGISAEFGIIQFTCIHFSFLETFNSRFSILLLSISQWKKNCGINSEPFTRCKKNKKIRKLVQFQAERDCSEAQCDREAVGIGVGIRLQTDRTANTQSTASSGSTENLVNSFFHLLSQIPLSSLKYLYSTLTPFFYLTSLIFFITFTIFTLSFFLC